jgi:erythromycin esterase
MVERGSLSVDPADAFVAWAKEHALDISTVEPGHGFADLQPIKAIVGGARVIALGEAAHGTHEFLAFRNRLLEFLVREAGVTALAAETGTAEGLDVDTYVNGGGVDVMVAAQRVFDDWYPAPLEENRALVEWMRAYNTGAAPGRALRFYGIDLPGGWGYESARRVADEALDFVERADPRAAADLRARLDPLLVSFTARGYGSLPPAQQVELTAAINELVNLLAACRVDFIARTTEADFDRALRHAVNARQLDTYFGRAPKTSPDAAADYREQSMARDAAMAENLRAVLHRERGRGPILLFAHNWHVKTRASITEAFPEQFPGEPGTTLGQYLQSMLGDRLVVVGSTFHRSADGTMTGPPGADTRLSLAAAEPSDLDSELARVGSPMFIVDIRAARQSPAAAAALDRARRIRFNERYAEENPMQAFDAMLYVDRVSDWRQTP